MSDFLQSPLNRSAGDSSSIIPLSLYIHIPWCVRKCPYCDFNSHTAGDNLQEELYVTALINNLTLHLPLVQDRSIISIFFGGGTPSLFSGNAICRILNEASKQLNFAPSIEITLEANPGTIDYARFHDFRAAGINRLSLGVQSFDDSKLKSLGRIHDSQNAKKAVQLAKQAGFENFNIDLMYGLPDQSINEAMDDLKTAVLLEPTHLSWYQLTIEPNTLFHRQPPVLPHDDLIWDMQFSGQQYLKVSGYHQYEVSAYAQPHHQCLHNLNYWQFGDYLGIGAGAHSKMSDITTVKAQRFFQLKNPRDYMKMFLSSDVSQHKAQNPHVVENKDLIFEFMLNALRLTDGVSIELFQQRTGLPFSEIASLVMKAKDKYLLLPDDQFIRPSDLGRKFLNNLVEMFL